MQRAEQPESERPAERGWRAVPRGVVVLGLVSLFMDISSEMIHALLPLYLTTVLGASVSMVGWIEGGAEATAACLKVFSGALSDRLGQRKWLAALGYALGAAAKPLFPLADGIGWIVAGRFVDRVGKGIRAAPRDALVGDLTPPELRGASYGLRQSLDSIGAQLGPALAVGLLALGASLQTVLWAAVAPAWIAVALISGAVREPQRRTPATRAPIRRADLARLDARYWALVAMSALLALSRLGEAFLVLRAHDVGVALALAPLVLVGMNLAYTLSSYPLGALSDRIGRHALLALGCGVLAASHLALATTGATYWGLVAGIALFGLHMGLTQGVLAALVADYTPESLRGTAFGVFHLASGVALLFGSAGAGMLWDLLGPALTFGTGAALALLTLCVIASAGRSHRTGT